MLYGYARISTEKQDIQRQIRNIRRDYPEAKIIEEVFTGTTQDRPKWRALMKKIKSGDTIVFDAVSRMSRSANEGYKDYMKLYDKGVNLVFLKNPYVNTSVYMRQMQQSLPLTGTTTDIILKAIEDYVRELAREQIKIAFGQSELEVAQLRQRTREGMLTAKTKGKQIGRAKGSKIETEKARKSKKAILQMSKSFQGNMKDCEVIEILGITPNTFYKYKKELKEEENCKK